MENSPEKDKLLHCQNSNCQVVSCRLCLERNHLPLSCKEFKEENGLDARHGIEEAMTEALIRKCSCGAKFFKDEGCNKMTCTVCRLGKRL